MEKKLRNNIDVDILEEEYDEVIKAKNAFMHYHKIPPEDREVYWYDICRNMQDDVDRVLGRRSNRYGEASIPEQVETYKKCDGDISFWDAKDTHKRHLQHRLMHKTMFDPCAKYLNALAVRSMCIRKLIDHYEPLNEIDVLADGAVKQAAMRWSRDVETNIGYQNEVKFDRGTPGTVDKELEERARYGGNDYTFKATLYVDHTYKTVIEENGIEVVDIGNKMCLTLSAEEIEDHDLKDQNVKLFKAKVAFTKVGRDVNRWSMKKEDCEGILQIEEKYIAVQHLVSGEKQVATGKDEHWAIRTMKSRMKRKMLKMMDII